jgi:hypothetical protein
LAKERGVISDAQLGLGDICAAVLGAKMDKTTPVRVSSNWDDLELSAEQLEYAALDPYGSLEIYHQLMRVSPPQEITDTTLPGTPVSVYQDDGQVIAHGILSREPPTPSLSGVNYSPTHAHVTIEEVLVPAAIIRLHKTSLSALGPTPFDILVKCTKLHSLTMALTTPEEPVTEPSGGLSTASTDATPTISSVSPELLQFLSRHVPQDSNWTEGVDHPQDTTDEPDNSSYDTEPDIKSLREGLALIQEMDKNTSAWPKSI